MDYMKNFSFSKIEYLHNVKFIYTFLIVRLKLYILLVRPGCVPPVPELKEHHLYRTKDFQEIGRRVSEHTPDAYR